MSLDLSIKILIVEDSAFMMKLFKKNLLEIGFSKLSEAGNGQEAISFLQENSVDLIISDWNMPEKDGMDLLNWVRADEKCKSIPFVMATAQTEMDKKKEAMIAGANSHIGKPFTVPQLQTALETALGITGESEAGSESVTMVDGKTRLRIAHIQITDHLVLGVLKHMIDTGSIKPEKYLLETERQPSWNPIQRDLFSGDIDAALVLAPIAMDLFAHNAKIKMTSLAHKNGSIFVRSKSRGADSDDIVEIFRDSIVNIPHKLSIHNMLAHQFLREIGLKPGVPGTGEEINVQFEVIAPIQMPRSMMFNRNVSGFIVAEPIGSNATAKGIADVQFLSSDRWKNHPCCIVAFQESVISQSPDAVAEFTSHLVQAGAFIAENKSASAEIAVSFLDPDGKLGLTPEVLEKVLSDPKGITTNDLMPVKEDFDKMQHYFVEEMKIGRLIDLDAFIETRFVTEAYSKLRRQGS
jgi:ABC-type nitrate/sulfonate/bicarbonate transport system substrate-binding protein